MEGKDVPVQPPTILVVLDSVGLYQNHTASGFGKGDPAGSRLIIYILVTGETGSFLLKDNSTAVAGECGVSNRLPKVKTDSLSGNGVPGIHSQLHKSETQTSGGEDQKPSQAKSCSHARCQLHSHLTDKED